METKEQVLNITDPFDAFLYVKKLGKRVPELETIIAEDARCSVLYAVKVLNNERFLAGEPVIKEDPKSAYRYAIEVIKGRWQEGESAITKDPNSSLYVSNYVLPTIKSNAQKLRFLTNKLWVKYKELYDKAVKEFFPTNPILIRKWIKYGDVVRRLIAEGKWK